MTVALNSATPMVGRTTAPIAAAGASRVRETITTIAIAASPVSRDATLIRLGCDRR